MAAKKSPFSMERNPTTWASAVRRVIIMRKASSTQAVAMPRVPRVTVPAKAEIGSATLNDTITSATPTSMVAGMFSTGSTPPAISRRRTRRRRMSGSATTLSASVSAAE
ncbi:MAG: hypothetical protein IPK20_05530 [Betaproteobacteria bacterium]|nr:hypothetical protein [Betaproteobacteria bacterium]